MIEPSVAAEMRSTLLSEFELCVARGPSRRFLTDPVSGVSWTRSELAEKSAALARALCPYGLEGQAAGILMGNRLEFFLVDLAVLQVGGVPVSLYITSSPEQLAHYICDAELRLLFVENERLPTIERAMALLPGRELKVIVIGAESQSASQQGFTSWVRLEDLDDGQAVPVQGLRRGDDEELATIICTSGTTGRPKGACLTHRNILAAVNAMRIGFGLREGDRVISWLPHAHVAERTCHYYCGLVVGLEVTICADSKTLPELVKTVEPDWFGAIPRYWEKLMAGVQAEFCKLSPQLQETARLATADGLQVYLDLSNGRLPDHALAERHRQVEPFLEQLRRTLGLANARYLCTGSAPTPRPVLEFFAGLGLPLRQMYGASETCTCASMETPDASRLGSVGRPVQGIELRIADDGEILLRGPQVMARYWRDAKGTAAAVDPDGWYATGDLGHQDEDGFLWITGRKKDLIINSSGQNISPQLVEGVLREQSPLIAHAVVVGDARPYNTALLVVQLDGAADIPPRDVLVAELRRAVGAANERLARVEQIKRFRLVEANWLPGSDELTATMKLRRSSILKKFATDIKDLYAVELAALCYEPERVRQTT